VAQKYLEKFNNFVLFPPISFRFDSIRKIPVRKRAISLSKNRRSIIRSDEFVRINQEILFERLVQEYNRSLHMVFQEKLLPRNARINERV
jgi:hypothetical protein